MDSPGLEHALTIVRHRRIGHQAALRNASALDWPMVLADRVLEARAALRECEQIEELIQQAMDEA